MKKLLSILLVILLCVSCVACSNAAKKTERNIADYLIDYLDEFKSPESVNVVTAKMNTKDGNFVELKISAKNSYGGTVTEDYILVLNTFTDTDDSGRKFYAGTIVNKDDESLEAAYVRRANAAEALQRYKSFDDIGNIEDVELDASHINEILNKYKKSQGWI